MQSCDSNFNIRRLERCLIIAREGDVAPVILLSKADLLDGDEVGKLKERIREAGIRVPVMSLSSLDGEGIGDFVSNLEPMKTYCLIGSSGVGKSTLLNRLFGEERLETRSVREKDHHGRHATTSRQLFRLESGSLFIDTPGMREIGLLADEAEVQECFEEIHALAAECKFRDCSHLQETGCAVLKALEEGRLQQERYDSFLKLRRETRFHQMSYVEKRKQDRRFGKMIHAIGKEVRERKRR
jgi:ribosome biogenesis GTPase